MNYLYLLSAASLGACFSSLYIANRFVKLHTFDDMYESTYWTRYVLGLMAGILIAVMIPLDQFIDPKEFPGFGPPILALLGGFAANFVYRVLDKMVKMMESAVKDDAKAGLVSRELKVRARLEGKEMQDRLEQAKQLARLQRRLAENKDPKEVEKALQEMQQNLMAGSEISIQK